VKADGASEKRAFAGKAPPSPVVGIGPALRDWLVRHVGSDAAAVETIATFFEAIERDLNADPVHSGALSALLARLKSQCVAALQPRAAQKVASFDVRLEKLAAENEAARKTASDLAPRLAELAERVNALEKTPAPPPLMPGFAPVSKSAEVNLDNLAAELALLSPEKPPSC